MLYLIQKWKLLAIYKIKAIPTRIVIDKDGTILSTDNSECGDRCYY